MWVPWGIRHRQMPPPEGMTSPPTIIQLLDYRRSQTINFCFKWKHQYFIIIPDPTDYIDGPPFLCSPIMSIPSWYSNEINIEFNWIYSLHSSQSVPMHQEEDRVDTHRGKLLNEQLCSTRYIPTSPTPQISRIRHEINVPYNPSLPIQIHLH